MASNLYISEIFLNQSNMIIDTFFFIVEPVRLIFHLLQCVFKFFLKRIKINSTQIELSIFIPFPFFFKRTVLTSIDRIYMSNCRIAVQVHDKYEARY